MSSIDLAYVIASHDGTHYCLHGRHMEAFGECLPRKLAKRANLAERQRDGARARADLLDQQAENFHNQLCEVLDPDEDELEPGDVLDLMVEMRRERDKVQAMVRAVEKLLTTDAPPFFWRNNRGTQARFRAALAQPEQAT